MKNEYGLERPGIAVRSAARVWSMKQGARLATAAAGLPARKIVPKPKAANQENSTQKLTCQRKRILLRCEGGKIHERNKVLWKSKDAY